VLAPHAGVPARASAGLVALQELTATPCAVMNATGQPEALCGIGINFRADKTGALLVSSLIEGGILRGWNPPPQNVVSCSVHSGQLV
jgi:hypothetical protein